MLLDCKGAFRAAQRRADRGGLDVGTRVDVDHASRDRHDQSMVRAGFRMLLTGEADIEVVAEAGNGREAVEKAARFRPTVILMDIRTPTS